MGSGPNWYQIGNETCYIPKLANFNQKNISMLTALKRSSFTYQCVFYRRENNAKEGNPSN